MPLTQNAQQQLNSIAQRYGVSTDAASSMLDSLVRGGGSMAQFSIPELGGSGQWMRGGMTMVGDMFNHGLKSLVDGLCNDLARLLESNPFEPAPTQQGSSSQPQGSYQSQSQGSGSGALAWAPLGGSWWPSELGQPSTSGSQNDMRYAYFPAPRRLAIEQNGNVTIYDTLNHDIGGVSQQQGNGYSLSFTSQLGGVNLAQLPVISSNAPASSPAEDTSASSRSFDAGQNSTSQGYGNSNQSSNQASYGGESESDVFAKIERLAALKQKGVLTDDEFNAKKAELLSRI
ncbi:MAG: hypothetical protein JWN48_2939 [Myxococcaceae bacterium]|nr:hypothetical protein [Myxococcaceae bacterium]